MGFNIVVALEWQMFITFELDYLQFLAGTWKNFFGTQENLLV